MTDLQHTAPAFVDTRYLDASLPVSERVEVLLAQMTLEEKAGLLFQTVIAINPDGTLVELAAGDAADTPAADTPAADTPAADSTDNLVNGL
ncbi:MAG TPA: hypothetical protein VGE78_07280, partial [Agromyces sp.]